MEDFSGSLLLFYLSYLHFPIISGPLPQICVIDHPGTALDLNDRRGKIFRTC